MTTVNNEYWLRNPIDSKFIKVLRRIKDKQQDFWSDQSEIAYLASRECVKADLDLCTLSITEKGEGALELFSD